MNRTCRLQAKGEIIKFDCEDGIKEYFIKPINNNQLLEIVKCGEENKGMEAALLLAKYSLNKDPKIVNGTEEPFDDEEIKNMETPFLMKLLETASEVNGLGDMFRFQQGERKQNLPQTLLRKSNKDILEELNQNPRVKLL